MKFGTSNLQNVLFLFWVRKIYWIWWEARVQNDLTHIETKTSEKVKIVTEKYYLEHKIEMLNRFTNSIVW